LRGGIIFLELDDPAQALEASHYFLAVSIVQVAQFGKLTHLYITFSLLVFTGHPDQSLHGRDFPGIQSVERLPSLNLIPEFRTKLG
jgi:hypothetical protein